MKTDPWMWGDLALLVAKIATMGVFTPPNAHALLCQL